MLVRAVGVWVEVEEFESMSEVPMMSSMHLLRFIWADHPSVHPVHVIVGR